MSGAWSSRDVSRLSADELRRLVNVCNCQREGLWDDVGAQGILDLHLAAADEGYDGFESFLSEEPAYAWRVLEGVRKRPPASEPTRIVWEKRAEKVLRGRTVQR